MTQLQLACETDGQTQARGPGVKRGSYGNCRAVETVEKRTACFSTVPTALGKLGKKQLRRVSHSSHSFGGWVYV